MVIPLFLGFISIVVALAFLVQTEWTKQQVILLVQAHIEKYTGLHVDLDSVDYTFPLSIRIGAITIKDKDKTLISMHDVHFHGQLEPMWNKQIILSTLAISELALHNDAETGPSGRLLPPPIYCLIEHFDIQCFKYHGIPLAHRLTGKLLSDPEEGLSLDLQHPFLDMQITIDPAGSIDANSKGETSDLSFLRAWWDEEVEGTVAFQAHVSTQQTLKLSLSSPGLTFGELKTDALTLEATVSHLLDNPETDVCIALSHIPLKLARLIKDGLPQVEGYLDATVDLHGPARHPQGQIHVKLKDVLTDKEAFSSLPSLEADLVLIVDENGIKGTGTMTGFDKQPATIAGSLPLALSLHPFGITLDPAQPMDLTMQAEGELLPLLRLFYGENSPFSGYTKVGLEFGGTLQQPIVQGEAELSNGTYESLYNGIVYKNLHALIGIDGRALTIKELSATDPFGGKITGQGTYTIDKKLQNPFSVDFALDKVHLINRDIVSALFTGKVNFSGNDAKAALTGDLAADELEITLPDKLPQSIQTLEVTFINGHRHIHKNKNSWPISLDLQLETSRALVNAKDLNSSWKGKIHLTGTTEAPELTGDWKAIRGSYSFSGKEFLIQQGTITFAGDLEKKTSLYVIASRDLDQMTAEIIVRGPIKSPTLSFRSNPPFSQREIVSWILFGRGIADITSTEGAELNQSITDLSTGGKGPDVLTKIRKTFGIDKIDITRGTKNDSSDLSVQVGKYLSRGVCVSVARNVSSDSNKVSLEANLTREVKIQAEMGDDNEGELLLKWKRDY